MSDYTRIFGISASGMSLERLRLEVASLNLANANAVQSSDGRPFVPLRVVATPTTRFESLLTDGVPASSLRGVGGMDVQPVEAEPRVEYDPGNPTADERGFVAKSAFNPVEEMTTVLSAVRAYEANVRALNAAKSMAMRAMEIGRS